MSIQGKVDELNAIRQELKELRARGAALRKRAKTVEAEITEYLEAKDQPGLKYKGVAIIKETATKHKYKNRKDARLDAIEVLRRYGIHNSERVLDELMQVRKGSPTHYSKLKIKPYAKHKRR